MEEVIPEATKFVAACYGLPALTNMTTLRLVYGQIKWQNHKLSSTLELQALPPTKEACTEHVNRANLQAATWSVAYDTY